MVVMVIGLLVVIWNFDLHRVISAKIRVRTAADAAALAAARWQGKALNMIGDLNLIQAALITTAYVEYDEAHQEWKENGGPLSGEPEPEFEEYLDYGEYEVLHGLRERVEFVGPLAAFAVAQQAAFNNGAFHDPELAANLTAMAEEIRYQVSRPPYDNAFKDYADLLDLLVESGVAVGSYSLKGSKHPLTQKKFYGAIAQALTGWWCDFHRYRNLLGDYEGFESWPKLRTRFRYPYMLDLKLGEFNTGYTVLPSGEVVPRLPGSAMPGTDDYLEELYDYMETTEVVEGYGEPDYLFALYESDATAIEWHVYDSSWARSWPRAAYYNDEIDDRGRRFPIRANVRPEFNYMGAEAGLSISAEVGRGILASSDNATVKLVYKTKAKAFGFLDTAGALEPPHYFGFVLPAFREVRLIHSDIGDPVLEAAFFRHVTEHLEKYMESGPAACRPDCRYCQLLVEWENLDRQKGLEWLEQAYSDPDNNPCKPNVESDAVWGKAGGGASGGS
jgi:hypothetical protein